MKALTRNAENVLWYFNTYYPYIDFTWSNEELEEYLKTYLFNKSLEMICDDIYDILLSEGTEAQE